MSLKLLLFDLDETIAPDEEVNQTLFGEIAAEVERTHHVPRERLVEAVMRAAETHWERGEAAAYCRRIGISEHEGLWGPFGASADPMLAALHAFAPSYRLGVWREALAACGVHETVVAAGLARRFMDVRRSRQAAYPWSRDVLDQLRGRYWLGMITNGAPDLQRLKLDGTGLRAYFDPLVVSGDLGVGKPEAAIFATALDRAGVAPEEAVMIGDSWYRDVLGAIGAGMRAVWINPVGAPALELPLGAPGVLVAEDLRALPGLIGELDWRTTD